jgi:FkbM family methyltransferase
MSALRTQRNALVILWVPTTELRSLFEARLANHTHCASGARLSVRLLSELSAELRSDPAATGCLGAIQPSGSAVAHSDLIRFLVLYAYGGIYVDMDTVFLRDLAPFQQEGFVHMWEHQKYPNTAIMGLPRGSPIVPRVIAKKGCNADAFYPTRLFENLGCPDGPCEGLRAFPCTLFDPFSGWDPGNEPYERFYWHSLMHDFFSKPMPNVKVGELYPGAFTFHWHNRWDREIAPKSAMDLWRTANLRCDAANGGEGRTVFLDLGAYTGDTVERYTKLMGQGIVTAYLFEADLSNIEVLLTKYGTTPWVHVVAGAAWDRNEVLSFSVSPKAGGKRNDGRLAAFGTAPGQNGETRVQVMGYDVGAFMQAVLRTGDRVWLKMDIEGAEVRVLDRLHELGLLLYVDRLIVEWHDWLIPDLRPHRQRAEAMLKEAGLVFQYQTLDDDMETHYGLSKPCPVNHCDWHYARVVLDVTNAKAQAAVVME